VLGEVLGHGRPAVADERQLRSSFLELFRVLPKLGGFRSAERSTEVAQEDQHCWPVAPQVAQLDRAIFGVFDDDLGELHLSSRPA
jgi:hypothetical protein